MPETGETRQLPDMDDLKDHRGALRRAWATHEAQGTTDDIRAYQVATCVGGAAVRVHVDRAGARHLLVPGASASTVPLSKGAAMSHCSRRLVFDGTEEVLLDVYCERPTLFGEFDDLLASILVESKQSFDPAGAALTAIANWRDLLLARARGPLEHRREMGLFAELFVLDLASRRSESFNPEHWRGPYKEPKDIVTPWTWAEVKAAPPTSETVRIHGLDQLADVGDATGFLIIVTATENESGTPTSEVVESLRERATNPDLFDEQLALMGWVSDETPTRHWVVERLTVASSTHIPRLVVADLREPAPNGVSDVQYRVDLRTVRSVSLPHPRLDELLLSETP